MKGKSAGRDSNKEIMFELLGATDQAAVSFVPNDLRNKIFPWSFLKTSMAVTYGAVHMAKREGSSSSRVVGTNHISNKERVDPPIPTTCQAFSHKRC